ncbi:MAG: amino acid ABC transporter permease, partial [Alphaproteobacteria bacterium]|nr:amino acid ABC transporter permease [Alphaproteobacteria bacterium]
MFADFDWQAIWTALPYLFLDGMTFTLMLTALSALGGVVLGTLLAMMRLSGLPVLPQLVAIYATL